MRLCARWRAGPADDPRRVDARRDVHPPEPEEDERIGRDRRDGRQPPRRISARKSRLRTKIEDGGSRIENRLAGADAIFDLRSSIFDLRSSIFDLRSSIFDPRSSILDLPTLRLNPFDLRADRAQFLFYFLVPTIDVIDAVDQGLAFSRESGQDQ